MKKGLSNQGENHCFLNVVIQTLWHLEPFRTAFKSVAHSCDLETCILCSLREVFNNYESSENSCIPPSELRKALGESFQGQFDVGQMADASEALTSIIEVLQKHDQAIGSVFMQNINSFIECSTCNNVSKIESANGYCLLFYLGSLKEIEIAKSDSFSQIIYKALRVDRRLCPKQGTDCPRSQEEIPISRVIGMYQLRSLIRLLCLTILICSIRSFLSGCISHFPDLARKNSPVL